MTKITAKNLKSGQTVEREFGGQWSVSLSWNESEYVVTDNSEAHTDVETFTTLKAARTHFAHVVRCFSAA